MGQFYIGDMLLNDYGVMFYIGHNDSTRGTFRLSFMLNCTENYFLYGSYLTSNLLRNKYGRYTIKRLD